jgi:hypothetical protein
VLRYNISENDAVGGRMGALTYYAEPSDLGLEGSWVYGNTFYSAVGPVLNLSSAENSFDNYLFNNIFVSDDGQPLVWDWSGDAPAGVVVAQGNLYWAADGRPDFQGRGSLADWRADLGQERMGGADVGVYADPLLESPGGGGAVDVPADLPGMTAYRLGAGSPAIDAGLDPGLWGLSAGPWDFFGGAVPAGAAPDIGAHELPAGAP